MMSAVMVSPVMTFLAQMPHVTGDRRIALQTDGNQWELVRSMELAALFNPRTPILVQKRQPYTGNLNSETPWGQ